MEGYLGFNCFQVICQYYIVFLLTLSWSGLILEVIICYSNNWKEELWSIIKEEYRGKVEMK